jgi:hypothetical protein
MLGYGKGNSEMGVGNLGSAARTWIGEGNEIEHAASFVASAAAKNLAA